MVQILRIRPLERRGRGRDREREEGHHHRQPRRRGAGGAAPRELHRTSRKTDAGGATPEMGPCEGGSARIWNARLEAFKTSPLARAPVVSWSLYLSVSLPSIRASPLLSGARPRGCVAIARQAFRLLDLLASETLELFISETPLPNV